MEKELELKQATKTFMIRIAGMSVLMQAAWLLLGWWSEAILLGNAAGAAVAVFCYLQSEKLLYELGEEDEEASLARIHRSMRIRHGLILVVLFLAVLLPWFDIYATVLAMFFPELILRSVFEERKKPQKKKRIGMK